MKFKDNFIFGVGASHFQIEENEKGVWNLVVGKDGSVLYSGIKHLKNWKEDYNLISDLGVDYYKISVAWPKLQKEPFGDLDSVVLKQYKKMFDFLKKRNVKICLVLHHFDEPSWFDEKGGWIVKNNMSFFIDFSKKIVNELKDYTDKIITFNEPSTYSLLRYYEGVIPSNKGLRNIFFVLKCVKIMKKTHHKIYSILKSSFPEISVSFSESYRPFIPYNKGFNGFVEKIYCKISELFLKNIWKDFLGSKKNSFADFLGIQYYGPYYVNSMNIKNILTSKKEDAEHNFLSYDDLWNHDISYLVSFSEYMKNKYSLPIIITENGTASEDDNLRINNLKKELFVIGSRPDLFDGYFHWSILDNFEIGLGFKERFGLVKVDYNNNFERCRKKSYFVYKKIVKERKI